MADVPRGAREAHVCPHRTPPVQADPGLKSFPGHSTATGCLMVDDRVSGRVGGLLGFSCAPDGPQGESVSPSDARLLKPIRKHLRL
jgi:hypothetical protein